MKLFFGRGRAKLRTIVLPTISNIFMDLRLVRSLEVPQRSPLESNPCQLGHRILRILFPGACESYRFLRIHHGAAQDHSGSHFVDSVRGFLRNLSWRKIKMELCSRRCVSRSRRVLRFPQMVNSRSVLPSGPTQSFPATLKNGAAPADLTSISSNFPA
jgi:hypothetical protein